MPFISNDYIDTDLAYILGLIFGRGEFYEKGNERKIIIRFSFKKEDLLNGKDLINVEESMTISLFKISERLRNTLGCNVIPEPYSKGSNLILSFHSNNIAWRILKEFTKNKFNHKEFEIHEYFNEFSIDILREFIIGFSDACGFIRKSNYDLNGRHRVYIQINNSNWILPIQICNILQEKLEVPVQLIQWGHPNMREPNKIDVKSEYTGWAREHQIKIFADNFLKIGFNFTFKQKLLEHLANVNIKNELVGEKLCNPKMKKVRGEGKP